jgi:hypothetical protein
VKKRFLSNLTAAIWRKTCNLVMQALYDDGDLAYCEACGHYHRYETSQHSEGCYFCRTCWKAIMAEIHACEHPEGSLQSCENDTGEPSICCERCGGMFVLTKPRWPQDEVELAKMSLKERLEFEEWMRRLDIAHHDEGSFYGPNSLWETTGATCWLDFFNDPSYRNDPRGALLEDLSHAD